MAKGISLHIGLNAVDPDYYEGWSGELEGCRSDAKEMLKIAKAAGFSGSLLLDPAATREQVAKGISAAADELKAGDIFLLTYSGHGGFLPDSEGDEDDAQDETWCLFNGEFLDDEIHQLLNLFRKGVRIFALSDSCHSGTILKNRMLMSRGRRVFRAMPPNEALKTYKAHREFYDRIRADLQGRGSREKMKASALLISACQDNQLAGDGPNGVFTTSVIKIWNKGKYSGDYRSFHKAIKADVEKGSDQTPNLKFEGAGDEAFYGQKPFTIVSAPKEDGEVPDDTNDEDRTEVSMPEYLSTIYTTVSDTWGSLSDLADLSREELVALNPHVAEVDEIVPGIPLNVPHRVRQRLRARTTRGKKTPYDIAREELLKNVAEIPGPQTNPRIKLYHASTVGGAEPDETAWCSSFVNWCVEQAGLVGTDSKSARSWHNTGWGQAVPKSQWREGDIVVFWRVAKTSWKGHVGFLVSFDGPEPEVLGGNQGNRLSIATPYPYSQILSVRRWT